MAIISTSQGSAVGTSLDDVILGEQGIDGIGALDGDDIVLGFGGGDVVVGGFGDDVLYGGAGNDLMSGDDDDDQLFGGSGNDRLVGGAGNDEIDGGSGNDILVGGFLDDLLVGGFGNDEFEFVFARAPGVGAATISAPERFQGNDIIQDFTIGNDHISVVGLAGSFDTNGNGRLDDGDDRVSADTEGFQSLVINFTNAPLIDGTLASGTLTLLGVGSISLGDISFDPAL